MADTKTTAETENTDPLGSDLLYMVDDPAGTPASRKIYMGSLNMLPDGFMINGELSVTVASNNLTVALKTRSGGNPSATDPVSVWINGTFRRCTASLSVTKNAATNWFNSGAAELATKEIDYFVYLIWNTTPGTDIMDIGFARVPYGRVYSDFSGTTTNEKYLAFANASTPTSTDDCVVIGRFAATLSAGAGYTWTVPTFTNSNLIHHPIYETRRLTYVPTLTGFSGTPTIGAAYYQVIGIRVRADIDNISGTSNATGFTVTSPFTNSGPTTLQHSSGFFTDNGTVLTASGRIGVSTGTNIIDLNTNHSTGAWTASGTKGAYFHVEHFIA